MKHWLFALIFLSSIPINALETGYKLTLINAGNGDLNNLVASADFIDIDLNKNRKKFGVKYQITDVSTDSIIFQGSSIINLGETQVVLGTYDTGEFIIRYIPENNKVDTQLQIRVADGSYNVVVSDF